MVRFISIVWLNVIEKFNTFYSLQEEFIRTIAWSFLFDDYFNLQIFARFIWGFIIIMQKIWSQSFAKYLLIDTSYFAITGNHRKSLVIFVLNVIIFVDSFSFLLYKIFAIQILFFTNDYYFYVWTCGDTVEIYTRWHLDK